MDLDARRWQETKRLEPNGELEVVQIESKNDQTTRVYKNLPMSLKEELMAFLRKNVDLFAWTIADMPRIDPEFIRHRLATFPSVRPIAQKRRKMSPNRAMEVQRQVHIREVIYLAWLSNVVMVKKSNGKWRMCVDNTDVNKACRKDFYPLT